jgi:ABC-type lipoprotein export system ATPase subunit
MVSLPSPYVELNNVSRIYKSRYDSVTALSDVNLKIEPGERLALLGRSGSGKSTLLNLLGGLDQPTSGTITVGQKQLDTMTSEEMASYRLDSVGMIFQAFNLIPTRTALQNVEMPFMFSGHPWMARRRKAKEALKRVGLGKRTRHRPAQLSGGEQQRVAIARALAQNPSLLLADEPTGNLDTATASEIMELLTEFSQTNNTAVILVTHDEELASGFADRVLRLRDGQLGEST